jgi:hypothetical protein
MSSAAMSSMVSNEPFSRWMHMFGGRTTYAARPVESTTYQGIYEDGESIHKHLVQEGEPGLFHVIPCFLFGHGDGPDREAPALQWRSVPIGDVTWPTSDGLAPTSSKRPVRKSGYFRIPLGSRGSIPCGDGTSSQSPVQRRWGFAARADGRRTGGAAIGRQIDGIREYRTEAGRRALLLIGILPVPSSTAFG